MIKEELEQLEYQYMLALYNRDKIERFKLESLIIKKRIEVKKCLDKQE